MATRERLDDSFGIAGHHAMKRVLACACLLLGVLTHPLPAQRNLRDIPDPDPQQERATFQLPDGFEVNLYASDPLMAKPTQINFDARGRLWVASSEVYPQIEPGQVANDKILVLDDRNHDGVADDCAGLCGRLADPHGGPPGRRRSVRRQQHRATPPT